MPKDSRSYRKRSHSRSSSSSSTSPARRSRRSRSRDKKRRSRSRDRARRSRSRDRRRSRQHRSRSRERRRSRSRDRVRRGDKDRPRRSRSQDHDRRRNEKRDHDRKKKKSRSRSKSQEKSASKPVIEGAVKVKDEPRDIEAEQNMLEDEMRKRRERIEQWRLERKQEKAKKEEPEVFTIIPPSKVWSLEDDDEEEDVNLAKLKEAQLSGQTVPHEGQEVKPMEVGKEEVDPLDAFMEQINDEVSNVKETDKKKEPEETPSTEKASSAATNSTNASGKVTFVMAVAKKKVDPSKLKGELMLDNQDLMEYSSEEEEEDLETTMTGINNNMKKKELQVVNHTKIYYAPFRKNFYVEVPEISRQSAEEVEVYREDLEGVKVRGKNCPRPIKSWAHCGCSKKIMEVLKRQNYEKPTPIQAQAIPAVMSGRDLIGIAKTGSGKTLAFLLPMFRHILDQSSLDEGDGPIGVILTPTRELAMQISRECKRFSKPLGLTVVCVYGGTGISEQIAELKRGTDIIVCTPGRMIDMLAANSGRVTNLRRCTYVVLDEADRMFDMGFEPQVMRILDNIRPDRQTVMFSATFPRQMEALARKVLQKPVEVQVGGRSVVCKEVEQSVHVIDEEEKFFKLLELLGVYQERGSVLVFVNNQEDTDELMKNLLKHTYPCLSLHGGIDQYDRDSTITDFKKGDVPLMIATSVAARGLDVKRLILVVNYDVPNHYEDYVHRCGRTGRAGNKGYAHTFITHEQAKFTYDIIKALEQSETLVPKELKLMWTEYKARAEAEGRKIYTTSGFRGKGFKFDETEAQLADDRRRIQKAALGLQDSDDDDAGLDIDEQIETMFASRSRVTDVSKPMANVQTTSQVSNKQKLEMAKVLAAKINAQRNLGEQAQDITQQAAVALLKGGISAPQVSSKTIAEQMAEKINAKLGYQKQETEDKDTDSLIETFKRYEEELDINDFPQTARWKVTSRDALAQISEYAEAGITVRGTFIPPKQQPKEDERRLYLAIEATSERAIQIAKKEVTRLIKEELIRLQNSYQPTFNKGRYKVLL